LGDNIRMRPTALLVSSLAILLTLGLRPTSAGGKTKSPWPHDARAAVSLTYDDALDSQLANAVPALDERGLHATFFLTGASDSVKNSRDRWVAAAQTGHELAVHTMFHPCPKSYDWVPKGGALEDYTLERMAKELDESIALVRGLTSKNGPLTFAYPCGDSYVGEDHTSYTPLIAERFLAARGVTSGIAIPGTVALTAVPIVDTANQPGATLVDWVRKAEAQQGWVVFLIHGVGAQHLPIPLDSQRDLLDYLAKNKKTVWTAPFGEVAARVKASAPTHAANGIK
jgi:peptidoglycan/xylan/chitin deacetylase (PgdA/CDA1 family)